MIYVSIDIETTGLNPDKCQMIEFSAIIEDTKNPLPYDLIPKFTRYIRHDLYVGEIFALTMNAEILKFISENPDHELVCTESELIPQFKSWLIENKFKILFMDAYTEADWTKGSSYIQQYVKVIPAGKNFSKFDLSFIKKLPYVNQIRFSHRAIDPAVLFVDWENDNELPDFKLCKERAGVPGDIKHRGLADAYDVIEMLRTKYQ